ncbi:MAG: hypothetical protein RLZZ450_7672 [Pseudomonadota bacterium]|jgi:hypothetical protein
MLLSNTDASVAAQRAAGTRARRRRRPRYNQPMSEWSLEKQAGFALAALLASDRELGDVRHAVSPAVIEHTRSLLEEPSVRDKTRLVAHLLSFVRPPLTALGSTLPVRLAVALAGKLPQNLARSLLATAPVARTGFQVEPDLLPRLLRIARRSIDDSLARPRVRFDGEAKSS